ncbi:hypothetical protein F4804DRAFT_307664 [Jackrogersella minutella]|nr:hypothetical protein F4804DRAFT_307664 [Jackrogersella minutella]
MSHETVGSLLAVIANSLNDALRIMMFADKRAWGSDEFEQLRLLEETLDEAKKDFQELPRLVNGRHYYENDRINESLEDLRILCTQFELHARTLKEWARAPSAIEPSWARETLALRRDLHRAQCRAARRVHAAQQVLSATGSERSRCLGALQVHRLQQRRAVGVEEERSACAQMGRFQRFGETDVAFVCDFCDGYLLWEDLRAVPTTRLVQPPPPQVQNNDANTNEPTSATGMAPPSASTQGSSDGNNARHDGGEGTPASTNWQARGITMSTGEAKTVVFAPVAIANHLPPETGEFLSRILCPQCDEYYYEEQGEDEMERVRYMQDDRGLEGVKAFQEHLEWIHASIVPDTSSCGVM